jgi:quinol monooxygenase YgiN
MNLQIGDYVIIDSESTSYFQERGIVQSIDIYGYVKIKIGDTTIKVKREELRREFNNNSSPYLNNKGFLAYQSKCQNKTSDSGTVIKEWLKQQIDFSLDTKDKKWFIQLTNTLSNFDEL